MTFKNICVKKTFQQNGETRTKWLNVGTLKTLDNGNQFIELNIFPNQDFYVFEQKQQNATPQQPSNSEPEQVINVENIPF